ncbi:MAG: hypothetical protein AAB403_11565 [Planctomycetota bacterium]
MPSEIYVVPIGEWDHAMYGHMKIDVGDIQQFIQNFNAGIRKDLRVAAGHDNGMSGGELPALGWFKELFAKEDAAAALTTNTSRIVAAGYNNHGRAMVFDLSSDDCTPCSVPRCSTAASAIVVCPWTRA